MGDLKAIDIPMGWWTSDACAVAGHVLPSWLNVWPLSRAAAWTCPPSPPPPPPPAGSPAPPEPEEITVAVVLGWIITAFAISLGAQFWFDALGKVLNLRATGVKPSTTPTG
jgi:hypothetical protein